MKPVVVTEIERLKDQNYLFRTLTKILDGLNALIGNVQAGQVTLVAGLATVTFSGLSSSSLVVACYSRTAGAPGTLRVDPADYDFAKKTFKIRSSSSTDLSVVTWHLLS